MVKKFWSKIIEGWKYFFTALRLDQLDQAKALETGEPVPNPHGNLKNWWKLFGWGALALVAVLLIIVQALNTPSHRPYMDKRKGGHHGINKYGKRY